MKKFFLISSIFLLAYLAVSGTERPEADIGGENLDSHARVISENDASSGKITNLLEKKGKNYVLTYNDWFRSSYRVKGVSFRKFNDRYVLKMKMKRKIGLLNKSIEPREVKFEIDDQMAKGSVLVVVGDYAADVKYTVP